MYSRFVYFISGILSGALTCVLVKKLLFSPEIEFYFLRNDNSKCQVCFINKMKLCKLDTCSYDLLKKVLNLIDNSIISVDVCSPCISIEEFASGLIKAHNRNVQVRIVTSDSSSQPSESIMACMAVGIRAKGFDKCTLLMHNKFIVIDKKIVVRGSLNWTPNCLQGNFENLQFLRRAEQVDWYRKLFDDLWCDENKLHPSPRLISVMEQNILRLNLRSEH